MELIGCMPMDVPGVVGGSCPTSSLSGVIPVDGCCNQANECGIVLDFLNLGCVENSTAARIALDTELTSRECGSG